MLSAVMRFWKLVPLAGLLAAWTPIQPRSWARERLVTPEMDRLVIAGVDAIYKMDFDSGEKNMRTLEAMAPDHPHPYFGLAIVTWMRFTYGTERTDRSLLPELDKRVDKAVRVGRAWTKAHPDDAEGYMSLGAAHGLRARYLTKQRSWLKAYWSGRSAMKSIRKAVAIDPELYDAQLGIGMYDYYTDLYPHFVRVLARLFLRGNRKRGIAMLKQVAEKGHYTKMCAKLLLVEIYNSDPFGEKDGEKAIELMTEIREAYPESPMFHGAELISLYQGDRYQEAAKEAEVFIERAKKGVYRPFDRAKGYVILGGAYSMLGQTERAMESFIEATRVNFGDELSRWAVWAHVCAGFLHDLEGRREKALEYYRIVKSRPDHWGFKALASRHISTPYTLSDAPFRILPP